jgi:hypothetical protein
VLPRAARPERPERLPALRPAASGRRALNARARLLPLLLAAALAGCGGDDEPSAETTRELPDLTVPSTNTTKTETTPTETQPTTTTVDPATETLPEEGPPPEPAEPPADSPENDSPPPADTPAERFEQWCDEHPGACG